MTLRRLTLLAALSIVGCAALCAQNNDATTYIRLGLEPYGNENYQKAADYFRKAAEADPKSAVVHLYLGTAYAMVYQTSPKTAGVAMGQRARTSLLRVLELSPNHPVALATLGSLAYTQAHEYEDTDPNRASGLTDAKAWIEKAVAASPQDASYLYYLCVIESELGDLIRKAALAKAGFNSYYDEHPIGPKAVRADLTARAAPFYRSALAYANKAVEIEPKFPRALYCVGYLTGVLADLADTTAEYKRQTQGMDATFQRSLDMMRSGTPVYPQVTSRDMRITPAIVLPDPPAPPPPPPPPAKK